MENKQHSDTPQRGFPFLSDVCQGNGEAVLCGLYSSQRDVSALVTCFSFSCLRVSELITITMRQYFDLASLPWDDHQGPLQFAYFIKCSLHLQENFPAKQGTDKVICKCDCHILPQSTKEKLKTVIVPFPE